MQSGTPSISTSDGHFIQWHDTGAALLAAELEAIQRAEKRVLLEQYMFRASPLAERFRDALAAAARRGVEVIVLLDYVGCFGLPRSYLNEVTELGGKVTWFNPSWWRLSLIRDHRKLLVVDDARAWLGGCNIAPEYDGDGVTHGWRDGGICIEGPVVRHLVEAFHEQAGRAGRWQWRRRGGRGGWVKAGEDVSLLLTRPGFHRNAFRWALQSDLRGARRVAVTMAYFLPVGRMKRLLLRAAKHAESFRLLLPSVSDVSIMQEAARALYGAFQRRGAQVYEYRPQVLHAKTVVADDTVYVGSANLDPRSIAINFEIMLRIRSPELAVRAVATFERDLEHSDLAPRQSWRRPAGWWRKLKQRIAWFIFTRLDPIVAHALSHRSEHRGAVENRERAAAPQ